MDLAIALDSNINVPLHQQLYEEIRKAILNGRLLRNQRIPSTRKLSKSLGISRTTVTNCYEQLFSEGYIRTIVGSGTYVCAQLPDDLLHSAPIESVQKSASGQSPLSEYAASLIENDVFINTEPQAPINFRYGRPAFELFPMQLWRKLLSRHCRSHSHWLDYATDALGYERLREAIARYLSQSRAVQCEPEQVMITNGTQQALYLVMRLLINPGDVVALEDPGYLSARRIFLAQGAKLLPVPVDESGLIVRDLGNYTGENIKLIYVTPSHQFPTGAILSLSRRLELLAWAHSHGAMIIEDDYDSEYRYGDRPIPALQGLDKSDCVLYMGTFSKVLFPSLRIGYLVLPKSLVPIFARAKWLSDRHLPLLEQYVLTDFIEEGHLERHIRKMRQHYDLCRQVLVQALSDRFGERVTILGEKAGLHLMVKLQTQLTDEEIIEGAASLGVGMISAQSQYLKGNVTGEFIFGYSELTQQQIREGIYRLAKVIFA
ncbi:MAG: PLP-dependent aminotransferase family protein [Pelatocladus maniniholoensis HA4357-MV3]|jgi:GntR family transcriptional regulator/MocR family aminotransferase|uniref:PLP-dependent aminotransferase family protein n=1 Tax=Pelatocladus maniniholoensis HA4357-MV3 TaxID=1117104 RepID=A0A9E3H6C0_9NOST|nr:PLP-dependent aminotransferase family protein [Pelatocladus maniniholoensis HA4357-MV3]BAZ66398.1 GntR family transcriptional regulator [Fischerella sp. NIES-4106]